jgi:hypothetical protein
MELKGKQLSLASKILSGLMVLAIYILSLVYHWNIAVSDLIAVGTFIALLFSPVDVSLISEKFTHRDTNHRRRPEPIEPPNPYIPG